jgi:hypothetical protein
LRAGPGPRLRALGCLIVLLALAAGTGGPRPAEAQALKLRSLRFPQTTVVGPWVTYKVITKSRSKPGREYTQRVAVVAREKYLGTNGFWVELKTEGLPSGTRIERGFFVEASGEVGDDEATGDAAPANQPPGADGEKHFRLVRYQVYTSGGKLYEYPVGAGIETRAGSDVSTLELYEYDPSIPPTVEELGPDTLRTGRRVVPAYIERNRRYGTDQWGTPGDTTYVQRVVLTQTFWKNPAVPITGFARSLFEVTTERWTRPAGGDSTGGVPAPETDPGAPPARPPFKPPPPKGGAGFLSRTELNLVSLGADAVPEVTMAPETAPDDTPPEPGGAIR